MSEDSESFELSFELEQRGDGPARVVRSVETHADGTRVVTEYEDALPRAIRTCARDSGLSALVHRRRSSRVSCRR